MPVLDINSGPAFGFGNTSQMGGPSFVDRLRMSNVLNPSEPAPGGYDPNMYMNQGEAPMGTPAGDRFEELLGSRPEYEGPGMLQKIAASMMALNDPRLAMASLQQPSAELVDWQNQLGPAQAAAEMEERRQSRTAGRELERGRLDLGKERLGFDRDKFANALTPADKHVLELEKIDLRGENTLEQIEARAVAARETGDLRHADTLDAIAARAGEARTTAGVRGEESRKTAGERERLIRGRPVKTTGATQLERERRIDNNIREYMDRHPEDADWFEEDNGTFTLKGAKLAGMGMPGFGPSKEERATTFESDKAKRDDILEAIYGGGNQATAPIEGGEEVMEKELPDGSGMAVSSDGGVTWQRK